MTLRETFDKILEITDSNPELEEVLTKNISLNETEINKQIDRLKAYVRLSKVESEGDKEDYKSRLNRVIGQFLEREYYYSFKKEKWISYFKDESYHYSQNVLEITNSTWEGESDILGIVSLKLTQMLHNLRKFGVQKDLYIDACRFTEDSVAESDKNWALDKVFHDNFSNDNDVSRLFIGNVDVPIEESESGEKHYYLTKYNTDDMNFICIESSVDVAIDPDTIPPERKLYTIDFSNDMKSTEAIQYETKDHRYTLIEVLDSFDLAKIEEVIRKNNIDIKDFKKNILEFNQSFDIDWKDYKILTPEILKFVRGNTITLRQLWQLRRDVNKLRSLSDVDDKYSSLWENEPKETRWNKIVEAHNLYLADRKALYQKVCDQMVENGLSWWD